MEATQSASSEKSKAAAVCAVEEIDVYLEEDRGFLPAIADVLRTTKRPILLTCNDTKKVPGAILDLVDEVEFREPTLGELFCHCALVLMAESVQVDWRSLLAWLESRGTRDYRSSVNELQLCWDGIAGGGSGEGRGEPGTKLSQEEGAVELASQMDAARFKKLSAQPRPC